MAMKKIPFSQLWIEEEEYLANRVKKLDAQSVIVEIGTAQGGSALILAESEPEKKHSVFSYDISPSVEAYQNLRGANVQIRAKSSLDGATEWKQKYGQSIDLLFIDGSHTLADVHRDFTSWFPLVKPGGKILFHDYDPIHRGGLNHLGVRVFIDALRTFDLLNDGDHIGRIFSGSKTRELKNDRFEDRCAGVMKKIGQNIETFLKTDFSGFNEFLSDTDEYATLLRATHDFNAGRIESLKQNAKSTTILVVPQILSSDIVKIIQNNNNIHLLDELTYFYLFQNSIKNKRDAILHNTRNRGEFFKWEEILRLFDHSRDRYDSKTNMFDLGDHSLVNMSKLCAGEVVRLNILKKIHAAVIG